MGNVYMRKQELPEHRNGGGPEQPQIPFGNDNR
jgi:hypothetical protein